MNKGKKPVGVLVPSNLEGPILRLYTSSKVLVYKDGCAPSAVSNGEVFAIPGKGMVRGVNALLWVHGRSLRVRDLTTNAAVRVGPAKDLADRGEEGTGVTDKVSIWFGQKEYVFFRLP